MTRRRVNEAPHPAPAKNTGMSIDAKGQHAAPTQALPEPGIRNDRPKTVFDKFLAEIEEPGRMEKFMGLALNATPTVDQFKAELAVSPSMNAGSLIDAFSGFGGFAELNELADSVRQTAKKVQAGDLSSLEVMLVSQATALQTIFTGLALRAQVQTQQRNMESFMSLALKAQSQSRATISALVDLKYPRQATFVKQANIANGPQQVNNGVAAVPAHEEKSDSTSKLSGSDHELLQDTRTSSPTVTGNPSMETVGEGHRAKVRRR